MLVRSLTCAVIALFFVALVQAGRALWPAAVAQDSPGDRLNIEQLRVHFARPAAMPVPSNNPLTRAKVALGRRLFEDPRLSVNGKVACASCHRPELAFRDRTAKSRGVTGKALQRHTPALWNLAWSPRLYWDGRALGLEKQARFPIEHPDEMGNALQSVAARLTSLPEYQTFFRKAFPGAVGITGDMILKAIASYERSIVSPRTRFDAWVEGETNALSALERQGFRLFAGKARCAGCHFGFAFTDHAFHDIGLPDSDLGRGKVLRLPGLNHAFKTPGLRELVWTAPYMHDGSIATLEDVLRHYVAGVTKRPTLAHELRRPLRLSQSDRLALIAFLKTLSSATPPVPSAGRYIK